jgi:pimeloyl-ACP methyl ester carboxylesterase
VNKPTRREFLRKSVLGAVGTGAALTAFRTEELLADSQITRDARSWYSEKGELTMKTPSTNIEPFKINISDEVLNDLTARLKATRFAPDLNNDDMFYGLSTKYMKDLVDHWLNNFDWKKSEKEINSFNQHRIEIEGTPVHFIYERGKGPNPTPIILSHGWPWTFWMWSKVIRQLTDPASFGGDPNQSFDVIVPSLLGFGFSTPLKHGDMNHWKMADIWQRLMTEVLGYEQYAAAGSDYGALITSQLGHKYAASLYGIHLCQDLLPAFFLNQERPWDLTEGHMVPKDAPEDQRKAIIHFQDTYASHVAVHMLDAQTITHGLNDSPVGLLAWILQRWKSGAINQSISTRHLPKMKF